MVHYSSVSALFKSLKIHASSIHQTIQQQKISNLMLMMRRKHIFCIIHVKFVRVAVCIGIWQGRRNVSHLTQYITRLLFVHKKHKDGLVLQFLIISIGLCIAHSQSWMMIVLDVKLNCTSLMIV